MSNTYKVSNEDLEKLRLILVSRINIVMALYPDKSLSQTELAKESGTDPGNLSRYIPEMKQKGILVANKENSDIGRPSNHLSLSKETIAIVNQNAKFLIKDESDIKVMKREVGDKVMELLGKEDTLLMAADELQRISTRFKLSPESKFLEELCNVATRDEYEDVRHVLLMSLNNFVMNLESELKENARKVLFKKLENLMDTQDDSDRGKRNRQIILKIFDSLDLFPYTYDSLIKKCMNAISEHQYYESQLSAKRLVEYFPEKVSMVRLNLIEKYGSVDEEGKKMIGTLLGMIPTS